MRGVEDLRWEGGGDVDEVVEGTDDLWGEILDEVGGLALLELGDEVRGCVDVGFERVDDVAGDLAYVLEDVMGA